MRTRIREGVSWNNFYYVPFDKTSIRDILLRLKEQFAQMRQRKVEVQVHQEESQ